MGLSEVGLGVTVESTGDGATASKAGCVEEEEDDEDEASADLLDENGQTMMDADGANEACVKGVPR